MGGVIEQIGNSEPEVQQAMMDALNLPPQALAELKSQVALFNSGGGPWAGLVSGVQAGAGSAAKAIKHGFHLASAAAVAGFGSVKDALQHPPKLRTKAWRLDHLSKQMKGVMGNLRKAIKVGDPFAIRYWETARAKVEGQQGRLKKRTVATMHQVKKSYKAAGVDVEGTWADIKNTTDTKSQAASQKAISEAQQTKLGIDNVDLTSSGTSLMTELSNGIYAGIPQVTAASQAAAAAAAAPLRAYSPPKVGPLSEIDKWGGSLIDAWVKPIHASTGKARKAGDAIAGAFKPRPNLDRLALAGGTRGGGASAKGGDHFHVGTLIADRKGLGELDRRMAGRRRIKRRDRRRVDSPNAQER
jgi:hypothetical protein